MHALQPMSDTLHVIELMALTLRIRSGELTSQRPQPFSDDPLVVWSPAGDQIVVVNRRVDGGSDNPAISLEIFTPTTGPRDLRIAHDPSPIPETQIDSFVEGVASSMRSFIRSRNLPVDPAGFSERAVRAALYTPAWRPPVSQAVVGSGGTIWLNEGVDEDGWASWLVVDPTDQRACRTNVPGDWRLLDVGHRVGVASTEGAFDVPQLLVFRWGSPN